MKKKLYSIVYMFVVTLLFAAMVSAVRFSLHERIEMNDRVKMKKIVLAVFGLPEDKSMSDGDISALFEKRITTVKIQEETVYAALEDDGTTPAGYAFKVSGPGFWGPIYAMAAVDAKADRILGVRFYRHVETPGLGARISEKWFTDQFVSLQIKPFGDQDNYFTLTRPGKSRGSHELDAVTGATMTSQAVERFLNAGLLTFVNELKEGIGKE